MVAACLHGFEEVSSSLSDIVSVLSNAQLSDAIALFFAFSLSQYIKENDEYIKFTDINQASRSAVSFDGEARALPLDADYIAMGWRQDVFTKHAEEYKEKYNEELKVPTTM